MLSLFCESCPQAEENRAAPSPYFQLWAKTALRPARGRAPALKVFVKAVEPWRAVTGPASLALTSSQQLFLPVREVTSAQDSSNSFTQPARVLGATAGSAFHAAPGESQSGSDHRVLLPVSHVRVACAVF